ncbi:hypothetical protein PRIPAC_80212 [Pristionchus pacificus]|uniref:Uncharacterized protein n=1 Tax=Pristionchus pacificus TaxID=54126 RepID=A0A8R1V4S0_PRIPA|nr:hypothetical protein PRIPAC_80212 [Pristionchus pacificus]
MRSVIGVLLLSSSALACIGGSSGGGGGCCAPSQSSCAPSAPPCGGPSPYASGGGSYPRPPSPYSTGAGGSYASPPAFPSFPSGPSIGGGYQQSPLSLPSHGFPGASLGGGSYAAPSGPIGGGVGGGYQTGPSPVIGGQQIGGGSYQAAPVLSNQHQGGSYNVGPSAPITGGQQIGGGSYVAPVGPAAVITTVKEEITAPVVVAPVAPAYGEKAVINNGPQTISKQTQTEVITDEGYGAKEEEYEEVEHVKTAPAPAPELTYEKPAAVVTTVVEKQEEKTVTGEEATEYEYEEEEKTTIAPVAPVVTVTDNYKAAAVEQNGQTEHAAGSEAALANKEEPSAYSAEEPSTPAAGASYEAVEQDGEAAEVPKQVEASNYGPKAVEAETTYDEEEAKKTEEEKKEEYKRNTIKRNSARRA